MSNRRDVPHDMSAFEPIHDWEILVSSLKPSSRILSVYRADIENTANSESANPDMLCSESTMLYEQSEKESGAAVSDSRVHYSP